MVSPISNSKFSFLVFFNLGTNQNEQLTSDRKTNSCLLIGVKYQNLEWVKCMKTITFDSHLQQTVLYDSIDLLIRCFHESCLDESRIVFSKFAPCFNLLKTNFCLKKKIYEQLFSSKQPKHLMKKIMKKKN